jgi:CheY-like chemotaxis protein
LAGAAANKYWDAMGKTILVIDDDPVFMEMAAAVLSVHRGATILRAYNGREALRQIDGSRDTMSLIICDLNMPERDGIEVILELGRRGVQTPVILITGAVPSVVKSAEALARIHGINVQDMLIKPVHARQLALTFEKALAA